jgi:broad specificity phosphatase PhoE
VVETVAGPQEVIPPLGPSSEEGQALLAMVEADRGSYELLLYRFWDVYKDQSVKIWLKDVKETSFYPFVDRFMAILKEFVTSENPERVIFVFSKSSIVFETQPKLETQEPEEYWRVTVDGVETCGLKPDMCIMYFEIKEWGHYWEARADFQQKTLQVVTGPTVGALGRNEE